VRRGPKGLRGRRLHRSGFHEATDEERKRLRIPAAWSEVMVNDDPSAHLQAVGRDAAGRLQYRYSVERSGRQAAAKFARLRAFDAIVDQLRERARRDARQGVEEAVVLMLIDATGFRAGTERVRGKEPAYGASTLRRRHVTVDGDRLRFSFVGKGGARIEKEIRDRTLAQLIAPRLEGDPDGRIFSVDVKKVRRYLAQIDGDFLLKDYRTWRATERALEEIERLDPPRSMADLKRKRRAVARAVAQELGNTPEVALASYIAPEAFQEWEVAVHGNAT
jgi:DNA topoisomerase-1